MDCFITCYSSSCTYLDAVPDSSGRSCIEALKRFISSFGAPKLINLTTGNLLVNKSKNLYHLKE